MQNLTDNPEDNVVDEMEADFADLMSNPKPSRDAADEGFGDMDDLLAEALQEAADRAKVVEARKKAKSGFGLSEDDQERIRRWELAKEWKPVANVAMFKRYTCTCGFHSTVFEGLMLEQVHRTSKINRWTAQESAQASLPNTSAIRHAKIPMCQRCCASKGYSLQTDLQWSV